MNIQKQNDSESNPGDGERQGGSGGELRLVRESTQPEISSLLGPELAYAYLSMPENVRAMFRTLMLTNGQGTDDIRIPEVGQEHVEAVKKQIQDADRLNNLKNIEKLKIRARRAANEELDAEDSGDVRSLIRKNLYDADEINNIQVQYLAKQLLVRDSLAWLYGDPGCFKSFIALDMAASIALGLDVQWASVPTISGPVLYIAAEGSAGMSKRKRAWEAAKNTSLRGRLKILTMAIRLTEKVFLSELIEVCKEIKPALIVIDTQSRVTPGLDENGSVMSVYVDSVTALREATGACVLTLHHTAKGTDILRGHGSLYGAADTVLLMKKSAGTEGSKSPYAKLSVEKQKDDRDDLFWNIHMQVQHFCNLPDDADHDPLQCSSLVPGSAHWGDVLTAQATTFERVLLVIRQLEPLQSITRAWVQESTNLPESTVRGALKTLCDQGELDRVGQGKSTTYVRPVRRDP